MSINVPQPSCRPGESPDFSHLRLSQPGAAERPEVSRAASDMTSLAYDLIRVLDDEDCAVGPWSPGLGPEALRSGLRAMLLTRAFDERMFKRQRQGKTSFYIKCTGEEAIACAQAMALDRGDMCFPTYRQQGLLVTRGYPLVQLMNQIYNNREDPLKGRQLPVLYSSREYGYFSLSGNVGSRFPHAVGWAMACAYRKERQVASAWIGDGSTATGDFHSALTFAAVYNAPVLLNIVNNQWAISSFQGIAGGLRTTFAARGVGYGLPALRVDGNDFLAVYSATRWARERALAGLGATVIELLTYRAGGHSTSDDPSRYRPVDEATAWPLGDPVERLKLHMIKAGCWSDKEHAGCLEEVAAKVRAASREAEAIGTLGKAPPHVSAMFEGVFKTPDWRLTGQRAELGC